VSMRIRDLGYAPGKLPPGPKNSILDVPGVSVGQVTIHKDPDVHTGVTVVLPRPESDIQKPCYAGTHALNGAGELTGSFQIKEWGWTNTPLALTNSVALGKVYDAIWHWLFKRSRTAGQPTDELIANYGAPVIGETCDWHLNDLTIDSVQQHHVYEAFENAKTQTEVLEGSHGGGTGMLCSQFKGGTGTSSRIVPGDADQDQYTVGVIVQTNHGLKQDLQIGGVPVGALLLKEEEQRKSQNTPSDGMGGSILVYIITDAPLLPHQLQRLAQRATVGVSQVSRHGVGLNPSGDIFLALSTANVPTQNLEGRERKWYGPIQTNNVKAVRDQSINGLFYAVAEATEEAILNSMVGARDGLTGYNGLRIDGLPVDRVKELLQKHLVVA
jgi:D-aminopeptidase